MSHTYPELKKKNVGELRDIAKGIEHEAVQGYTQMNKEHLLEAICKAYNLDMHEHHHAIGANKTSIKAEIRKLKQKRDEAAAAKDMAQHKFALDAIHTLKRKLHKNMV